MPATRRSCSAASSLLRGQVAVPQQVGDLLEALVLGEPLRVVAPVDETAVLAVHERDLGTAERDALEARPGQVDPVGACVRHGRKSRADACPTLPAVRARLPLVLAVLATLALGLVGSAPAARADGDPASDVLLVNPLYTPVAQKISAAGPEAAEGHDQVGRRVRLQDPRRADPRPHRPRRRAPAARPPQGVRPAALERAHLRVDGRADRRRAVGYRRAERQAARARAAARRRHRRGEARELGRPRTCRDHRDPQACRGQWPHARHTHRGTEHELVLVVLDAAPRDRRRRDRGRRRADRRLARASPAAAPAQRSSRTSTAAGTRPRGRRRSRTRARSSAAESRSVTSLIRWPDPRAGRRTAPRAFGVTVKPSPQWPTITSAGAERE